MSSHLRAMIATLVLLAVTSPSGAAQPDPESLRWFRDARFGMFIHWGPVSLKGTEIGWSRGREVPVDEYDQLYTSFNPTEFDAAEWVATAKAAGMKYIVITSKHHDGFSLWDSKVTDYDIMATPFARDVLAELSAECKEQDIRFCIYYSILDWWHPDYPTGSPGGRSEKPDPHMDRYVTYMKAQLKEIADNYGPLGIVWFDGQWEKPWTYERGQDLLRYVRGLQPHALINNRVGRTGPDGTPPGDYDTPEQHIGAFQTDRPWESCITICRQWAWKPDDRMKSLKECIDTLVRTAGGDGNLLFNVGPMPNGRIEPRQVDRLMEIGAWLEVNGESIYGTRGGPFKPGPWGVSTYCDNTVYLHVLEPAHWPKAFPPIAAQVRSAHLLENASFVRFLQTDRRLIVGPADPVGPDTIVVLTLDRPASEVEPVDVPSGSLATGAAATASNVFQGRDQYAPGRAFDDDPSTRWATDAGTTEAWIEVDLGAAKEVSRVRIAEADEYGARIRRFELQAWDGQAWQTALSGTTVGREYSADFAPVSAQRFRLAILEATDGPTISEIHLFGPE